MLGLMARRNKLGSSGIEVGPLALGGNVFGWTLDEPSSFRILDAFVAFGLNLIDTADVYSTWIEGNRGGESEAIIGAWLGRGRSRSQVAIATKTGMDMGTAGKGLSRAHILRSADDSLRLLRTEYIDLYQAHKDDPDTPLEETLEAFATLLKQGKIRAVGASNYSAGRLAEALAIEIPGFAGYQSLQPLYNLYDRAVFEEQLEPMCVDNGLAVFPYFSLASGFLTGKYRSEADLSKSARGQGVKKYMNERGSRILAALDEAAARQAATPAQVALAWLMARPSVTAPISSATSVEQLNELVAAARLKLDPSSIELLNQASL
jgi:aryl-alcohol dehydrogenase-like predicted oxidoreductase